MLSQIEIGRHNKEARVDALPLRSEMRVVEAELQIRGARGKAKAEGKGKGGGENGARVITK